MQTELLMGNEAMAWGAIHAGVGLVCGYPGTPSTEVLETIAKHNPGHIYVEWSTNEKSAMEVAAGAAYAGQRVMVTMKQVGLNVASDALMSLAYIGVKGGMVVLVADDPGPISSQTEQDTRHFAAFSKLPVFDPVDPAEAYEMIMDAFAFSEKHGTPVLFRPTTRICHASMSIKRRDEVLPVQPAGFERSSRWVIFPRLAYQSHLHIEARNRELSAEFSASPYNSISMADPSVHVGLAAGGVSYQYTREALQLLNAKCPLLKISTPHPFPEDLAVEFLRSVDEVLVAEELDPVIEKELVYLCGKHGLAVKIRGKLSGHMPVAGEYSTVIVGRAVAELLGRSWPEQAALPAAPELPVRPPVLCAGCPHRAAFYAVKQATKGKKAYYAGDIGCYTLGNAPPLNMVDTCLCMGADVTIAQGLSRVEKDAVCYAFIGDSTFFHTGLAGVVNAVYNDARMVLVVLDNSTTAMTGQQPNPSTGENAMGEIAAKISIEKVLQALGVEDVQIVDPLDTLAAIAAAQHAAEVEGVSAIIYRSPCIAVCKPGVKMQVDEDKCINCKKCIKELGCPAIIKNDSGDKVCIDSNLCYGCGICRDICPTAAIGGGASV